MAARRKSNVTLVNNLMYKEREKRKQEFQGHLKFRMEVEAERRQIKEEYRRKLRNWLKFISLPSGLVYTLFYCLVGFGAFGNKDVFLLMVAPCAMLCIIWPCIIYLLILIEYYHKGRLGQYTVLFLAICLPALIHLLSMLGFLNAKFNAWEIYDQVTSVFVIDCCYSAMIALIVANMGYGKRRIEIELKKQEMKKIRKSNGISLSPLAMQLLKQSNRKTFLETIQISGRVEISYLFSHMNLEDEEGWDWIVDQGAQLGCKIEEDSLVVPEVVRDIFIRRLDEFLNSLLRASAKKKDTR